MDSNHCDATCSGMDLVGIVTLSNEEVERGVDEALKPDYRLKYDLFMYQLRDNHPIIYTVLRSTGLSHPY